MVGRVVFIFVEPTAYNAPAGSAQQEKTETFGALRPVNHFEDVSVVRFTGYKPGIE